MTDYRKSEVFGPFDGDDRIATGMKDNDFPALAHDGNWRLGMLESLQIVGEPGKVADGTGNAFRLATTGVKVAQHG
ncbi:MAG: hypothetical protein RL177_1616, partial [Bacteroidota bacterium]